MRELGDPDGPDENDSNPDALPEHADNTRQPRYETVPDAATRRASALEYRQRVEAEYAAYNAKDAQPEISSEKLEPSRGTDLSWPPPKADQDEVRQLYREYLAEATSRDRQSGRDQGTNVIGSTPDQSPGELSGLPPPGDELAEIETNRKSRISGLLDEAEKEENLDGLRDAVEENTSSVQKWLSARPPEGHAAQNVPTHHPYITPWVPEHGIEGADAASAILVAGILTAHMIRWANGRMRHREGDHDDGN
jgi:hypothetical protein